MINKLLNDLFRGLGRGSHVKPGARGEFLPHYDRQFAPLLARRAEGFRVIFELLEARCKTEPGPALIVETGSIRKPDSWAGDGQSTLLWKEFGEFYPSEIHTVDINPAAGELVRSRCGSAVHVHTEDSVRYLYQLADAPNARQIDMLYLDSFDFNPNDPFPSAFHHMQELVSARPCLRKGSIVAVDDNMLLPNGELTGKGYLVAQWFSHLGYRCVYEGYQFVWQL